MISTNDFRTGLTIELNGDPCQVIDFQHVKPGKGAAFVRAKIKNLKNGSVTELTFRAGEKVPKAILDRRQMQYLYYDGENYVFMDNENFEQIFLTQEQLDGAEKFLKENMECQVMLYQGKVLGVDLPNT
ncbi:MAG: elongation factor P, partial [Clostridia bacterium]|nr:elongation factor P [Clostridia bacterium]